MAYFIQHYGGVYLRSEIEEVVDKWDELSKLDDEEALATFIGKCFLRANKASAVSPILVVEYINAQACHSSMLLAASNG